MSSPRAIPPCIHQIWIQGPDALPPRYLRLHASWRAANPGWEHRVWDDGSLDALIARHRPGLLRLYRSTAEPVARADLGRYVILAVHGGLYADTDTRCVRPVSDLLDPAVELMLHRYRPPLCGDPSDPAATWLCNSLIASRPGHPFWATVLSRLEAEEHLHELWFIQTGPDLLRECAVSTGVLEQPGTATFGRPQLLTAAHLPRLVMRLHGLRRSVFVLDYNDSARAATRQYLRGLVRARRWRPPLLRLDGGRPPEGSSGRDDSRPGAAPAAGA